MVRWFKLFGDQYLGFWGLGLVLFVLQEVPYIVMPFFPLETNPIMQMTETSMTGPLGEDPGIFMHRPYDLCGP